MKKFILKSGICTLVMFIFLSFHIVIVSAASFSISKSQSSVSPGASFTVTISASGAGQFSVSASNGSVSSSSVWVDGSASVTCKAGQSGTTTVTVTAQDATGYDETPITGSKSTSVTIKSSSSSSGQSSSNNSANQTAPQSASDTKESEVKKSAENKLSSLTISSGKLSPSFSANTTTYDVELTSDVESLIITAKAKDSKAKVSGNGKKALKIGVQAFEIVVTAENGSRKSYTINVNVAEKPTVFTSLGDTKLGILKSSANVEVPKGYKSTTIELEGETVNAWSDENSGMALVYLMDEEGNKNFYIVEDGKVVQKYETLTVLGKVYTILNIPDNLKEQDHLKQSKVKIDDIEIEGWTFEDENLKNYSVVYLMNDAGKKNLYVYEGTEGTLQKYTPIEEKKDNTLTYVFIGTTVVFVASTATLAYLYITFKKKSISAIKDYYDRKNQG